MVSGGQGDVNSHTMYIVRVGSPERGKFDILVISGGQGDANSPKVYILRDASRQRGKF